MSDEDVTVKSLKEHLAKQDGAAISALPLEGDRSALTPDITGWRRMAGKRKRQPGSPLLLIDNKK
jgi:hypothetical protein